MKKTLFFIMPIAIIAGCMSTPQSVRQKSPDSVHSSTKAPKDIAMCIADKWESFTSLLSTTAVNFRPIQGGYTVYRRASGEVVCLVDIMKTQNGSKTKFYNKTYAIGENPIIVAVTQCQL